MSHAKLHKHLHGHSALVQEQFRTADRKPAWSGEGLQAYSVRYTDRTWHGRAHKSYEDRTAVVVASSPEQAMELAASQAKRLWPKLYLDEFRLEDTVVFL